MLFDLDEAIDRHSTFKAMALEVVSNERNSTMAPESAKKIKEFQKKHALANKKEYFTGLFPKVVKEGRLIPGHEAKTPKANEEDNEEQPDATFEQERDNTLEGDVGPVYKTFEDSGLDKAQDRKYVEGLLPILEKDFGLSTPKPDFVFGFAINNFPNYPEPTEPRISHGALQLVRVAPGVEHPSSP